MEPLKKFFKKISIAESMTMLFIFSIGISLLYKYGFYSTLGIDWYLYNLSPQQLIISSIGVIFFFILGGVIGLSTSIFKKENWLVSLILVMSVFIIFGAVIILKDYQRILWGIDLNKFEYYISILMYTMVIGIFFISFNNLEQPDDQNKFEEILEKISPTIFFILASIFLVYVVYSKGVDEARAIILDDESKKIVKLKDDSKTWGLIEVNGDKVLIILNEKPYKYKLVEYKDIEFYSTK